MRVYFNLVAAVEDKRERKTNNKHFLSTWHLKFWNKQVAFSHHQFYVAYFASLASFQASKDKMLMFSY